MKIISEYDIEQIKPQTPQSAEYLEITKKFRQMSVAFEGAIDCIMGTLKTIEQEMIESGLRIPIHSVTSRIKSPDSTRQKLARHGLPYTIDNVMNNLNDIAGVRIICKYITDIYHVRDLLLKSDHIIIRGMHIRKNKDENNEN